MWSTLNFMLFNLLVPILPYGGVAIPYDVTLLDIFVRGGRTKMISTSQNLRCA